MILELSGTPSAGKDSIIRMLCDNKKYGDYQVITQDDEEFTIKNSNFDLRILWGIFDTYSKIKSSFSNRSYQGQNIIIFNRGLLDMIAWTRLLRFNNQHYMEIADYIDKWLKAHTFLLQTDVIFLLLTSYDKILSRRKQYTTDTNSIPWIINPKIINKLNEIYLEIFIELQHNLPIIIIDDLNNNLSLEEKFSIVSSYIGKNKKNGF